MGSTLHIHVSMMGCFSVGQLLIGFDEETIDQTFNISDPLHKKALLNSIHTLKDKGVKPPSNLWEFKVKYYHY